MSRQVGKGSGKKSKSINSLGEDHKVSLSVAFSLVVNKPAKEPYSYEVVRDGESKRIYENLNPEHYFRVQYNLLPSGANSTAHVFKTDVVNFGGVVSKIYTDKFSRVLQCWPEEVDAKGNAVNSSPTNKFSWRHKHSFLVSKSSLLELHDHVMEVRLWSSSRKVATSTRYDRPKAFKLPSQSMSRELITQPVQYPLVSHNPAVAMCKVKGEDSQGTEVSDDSFDVAQSYATKTASSQATLSDSEHRSSQRPISKKTSVPPRPSSLKVGAAALPPVNNGNKLPNEIAGFFSSTLIPETDEIAEPSVRRVAQKRKAPPNQAPVNRSRQSNRDTVVNRHQEDIYDNLDDSDSSTSSSDDACSHLPRPHRSARKSRGSAGASQGQHKSSKLRTRAKALNALKLDERPVTFSQDSPKISASERPGAPPNTVEEDQQEAKEMEEPEGVAYSETPPSQITPHPEPFLSRSGAPIIRVLLDPDLFPPMTVTSLKCRRKSSDSDLLGSPIPAEVLDSRMAIRLQQSFSLPSSPVNMHRTLKKFLKLREEAIRKGKKHVDWQVDSALDSKIPTPYSTQPQSRQQSARKKSGTAKKRRYRTYSASPTRRSLKKITRELSKILARSIHFLKSDNVPVEDIGKVWSETQTSSSQSHLSSTKTTEFEESQRASKTAETSDANARQEKDYKIADEVASRLKESKAAGTAHKTAGSTGTSKKDSSELTSAEAKEQNRVNREGLVVLRLKMSELFSTKGFVKAQLDAAIKDVMGFDVGVYLTSQLMPEHLVRDLRPMAVTVEKVVGLPSNPGTYQDLVDRCDPAYVQYQLPSQSVLQTQGLPQAPVLPFRSCNVVLLGNFDDSQFLEFLRGPPLTFELHDRDPRKIQTSSRTMFGQDAMDDIIGTHMFGASLTDDKRLKLSVDSDEDKAANPVHFGMAKFDLSGFLKGGCRLEMSVPVHQSPRGVPHKQPSDQHLVPAGNYVDMGCEMIVTFEIWRPLDVLIPGSVSGKTDLYSRPSVSSKQSRVSPKKTPSKMTVRSRSKMAVKETAPCPFNRLVYLISTENGTELLDTVLKKINEINATSLRLDHLPEKVLSSALSTYKLTREQLANRDVVTGFHVEDIGLHILVLEGLKDGGIKTMWEACPRHYSQHPALIKVFYNSKFEFSERLYGALDVDLPKITLSRPLKEIMLQPFIYLQGSVPRPCFRALTCLNWLGLVDDMLTITRNDLFPSAQDISSLSLHFSLPAPLPEPLRRDDPSEVGTKERGRSVSLQPLSPNVVPRGRTRRIWTPLDLDNPEFVATLRHRAKLKKDFVVQNKNYCEMLSEMSRNYKIKHCGHARSSTVPIATMPLPPVSKGAEVHNYSTQTYNSTHIQMEQLRQSLKPGKRYTFCQDYWHRSIAPAKYEVKDKVVREPDASRWLTSKGFNYPGVPSTRQSNKHPFKPTSPRLEELSKPFQDNVLHQNTLCPTVDRMEFSSANHKLDFDLWTWPQVDPTAPSYVMKNTLDQPTLAEKEETKRREEQAWEQKVVVDNTRLLTYRSSTKIERSDKAVNRTEALRSLLKDPPMKQSFRDVYPTDLPPLSVVNYPQLDPHQDVLTVQQSSELPLGGFTPGPFFDKTLKLSDNHIPYLGRGEEEVDKRASAHQSEILGGKDSIRMYWDPADSRTPVLTSRHSGGGNIHPIHQDSHSAKFPSPYSHLAPQVARQTPLNPASLNQ